MAMPERVSPHSTAANGGGLVRRVVAGASLLVLVAACVACAVTLKTQGGVREELAQELAFGDSSAFKPSSAAATREGSVRRGVKPDFHKPLGDLAKTGLKGGKKSSLAAKKGGALHQQQLAFGDADGFKKAEDAQKREGGVRHGVKPDFHKPLGDLGNKGLAKGGKVAAQALAFGDADGFKTSKDAQAREGSVRNGVKPDFHKPLGDLGNKGLAKTGKKSQAQALAFGDSSFHAGSVQVRKEGSVRGGKVPDFKPPLGSLGETGLVQKHKEGAKAAPVPAGKAMSAMGAREAADSFFSREERAEKAQAKAVPQGGHAQETQGLKGSGAAAKPAVAALKDTHRGLDQYWDKLVRQTDKERSTEKAKAAQAASKQQEVEARYFEVQQAGAARERAEAIKRGLAEDKEMAKLVAKEDKESLAAHGGEAAAAKKKGLQAVGVKTQKLADGSEGSIFGKPQGNKHGFHAVHMSAGNTEKQLQEAQGIEKKDLDDCAFTLC